MNSLGANLGPHLYLKRYSILLISFVVLLFASFLQSSDALRSQTNNTLLLINVLAGILVLGKERTFRVHVIRGIAVTTLAIESIVILWYPEWQLAPLFYIIYFFAISSHVYTYILRSKEITDQSISAVFCGFIMLGLIGAFVYSSVEGYAPGSFSGLNDQETFDALTYYSFIAITTVGFGDIQPTTPLARAATMLFCLAAYFYTVIVTGILIGKYLKSKS